MEGNQVPLVANADEEDDMLMIYAGAVGFVMFFLEDDYEGKTKKPKRKHRFWSRSWFCARNNAEQANTMYKLQQELLEVGLLCKFSFHFISSQCT